MSLETRFDICYIKFSSLPEECGHIGFWFMKFTLITKIEHIFFVFVFVFDNKYNIDSKERIKTQIVQGDFF